MATRNKRLLFLTIIVIIFVIAIGTAYKVYKHHEDNLYRVVEQKIKESARDCFLEEKCEGTDTTLGFLIENEYISDLINPITKEYIAHDLKIEKSGEDYIFNIR